MTGSKFDLVFRLDLPVESLSRITRFRLCTKPDLDLSRKGPFSTDGSDCIRIGLYSFTSYIHFSRTKIRSKYTIIQSFFALLSIFF